LAMTSVFMPHFTLHAAGAGQHGSIIPHRCASQLVRAAAEAKGQQQQQSPSWVPYAAAAAAVAAGASYFLSAQPILSARASPASPGEQPSSAAEAAVTALLLTPLSSVLQGTSVPQAELHQYADTLAKEHAALQCWELSSALWGLAHLLPTPSPQQQPPQEALQQLQAVAQQRLHSMPLFPAILAGWSLLTMDAADDQVSTHRVLPVLCCGPVAESALSPANMTAGCTPPAYCILLARHGTKHNCVQLRLLS
jgi:hypothetical protein